MANSRMIGGGCALYSGFWFCCAMIGLFTYHILVGILINDLEELFFLIVGGSDLKVLVNSTDTYSTTCSAACKTVQEDLSDRWLYGKRSRKGSSKDLHEVSYKCQKVSGTKSECPCESGKKFFVESTASFGSTGSGFAPSCLLVEHIDADDKKTGLYGADIDAIFLPKGKNGVETDTLLLHWNKADATVNVSGWTNAYLQDRSGIVGGAVVCLLCMLCMCCGGGFVMYKAQQSGPSQQQLHEFVDMAVERFGSEGEVPSGFFNEVAAIIKNGFPVDLDVASDDPFFSRQQVQRVLELVAEKCGERLAQRAFDQR